MARNTRTALPSVFRIGRFKVFWSEVREWSCCATKNTPVIHTIELYDGTILTGRLVNDHL